ncbi:MAG: hypothetical protein ACRD17_11915 [Terriglobales bacterium]
MRQNFDARMAADRAVQAQAQLGVMRSAQYPQVGAGVELFGQRSPKVSNVYPAYSTRAGEIDLAAIWNLDSGASSGARMKPRATSFGHGLGAAGGDGVAGVRGRR